MQISRYSCRTHIDRNSKNRIEAMADHFDETDTPFGMVCSLPSPFTLPLSHQQEMPIASQVNPFESLPEETVKELAHFFSVQKNCGTETTTFSLSLPFLNNEPPIEFVVKSCDTAKMVIQVELNGAENALQATIEYLPQLFAMIAASVYPYELSLILPPSIHKSPLNSVSIKELCKERQTVYGVNEDEQAL
ncbi:MAG: hypothetical protein ACOYK9_03580 [Chlamydiia bacterium]